MAALSALRPGHWIGIGLVAALIASGAWTNVFGLLGGNASAAKRLDACLENHGASPASLVGSVGNPTALLSGAKATDALIRKAAKKGKLKNSEANTILSCLRRVSR